MTADKDDKDIDETSEAVEITEAVEISEPDIAADFGDEKVAKVASTDSVGRRLRQGAGRNIVAILVAVALVTSAGVAAGLYFFQFDPAAADQCGGDEWCHRGREERQRGTADVLTGNPGQGFRGCEVKPHR